MKHEFKVGDIVVCSISHCEDEIIGDEYLITESPDPRLSGYYTVKNIKKGFNTIIKYDKVKRNDGIIKFKCNHRDMMCDCFMRSLNG